VASNATGAPRPQYLEAEISELKQVTFPGRVGARGGHEKAGRLFSTGLRQDQRARRLEHFKYSCSRKKLE